MTSLQEISARFVMLRQNRLPVAITQERHPAAVLIVLTPATTRSGTDLILIRRPVWLRHHPGQLCFPGGKKDEQDGSLLDTALRETREELGIELTGNPVIGALPRKETVTGFSIQPYLMLVKQLPAFHPSCAEVDEVIRLPLEPFMAPGAFGTWHGRRNGSPLHTLGITVDQQLVWGATAGIILDLVQHLGAD